MFRDCCAASTAETLVRDLPVSSKNGLSLQGSWVAIQAIRNGREADYIRGLRLIVEGDRFLVQGEKGDMLFRGTVQVTPGANPSQIDLTHERDTLEGTTWQGIYQLNGNSLRICSNSPNPRANRPDEFNAPLGSERILILLRRG